MDKQYSYSEIFNYFGKLIDFYLSIDDEGKREILNIIENNTFDNAEKIIESAVIKEKENYDDLKISLNFSLKYDNIIINGRPTCLKQTQKEMLISLIENYNKSILFNLNRQTGFTTMFMQYAIDCARWVDKNVVYFTNSHNSEETLLDKFKNEYLVWWGYRLNRGKYNVFSRGNFPGKLIVTNINKRDFDDIDPDIVIFDNADFYNWTYLENSKFQHLVEKWSKDKNKQIIIGSVPNPNTDIFESYFKRLWCDDDNNNFRKVKVTAEVSDDIQKYFLDYSDARQYDFEYCNADNYFMEVKPLYNTLKGL